MEKEVGRKAQEVAVAREGGEDMEGSAPVISAPGVRATLAPPYLQYCFTMESSEEYETQI